MPSYTMRRVQVIRREYAVPCYGEGVWDGCAHDEVEKAVAACRAELSAAGVDVYADTIKVRPGDSEVIVYYVTEENLAETALVDARNDAVALRTQLRRLESALAELIGDSRSELSATTLTRLERQLGDIHRALRQSESV
ncbi:hypothetical protein [Actinophytocola sp.]|uniref:hypothetical protein n=1 Tax=Actinophytocola sp. TaxID=1872138 RepID=UPI002D7FD6D3|nr:hypothetical protein [Actinophytocola sp.]HET9144102.1 hypothetical protein [Actinophytocola sp.]